MQHGAATSKHLNVRIDEPYSKHISDSRPLNLKSCIQTCTRTASPASPPAPGCHPSTSWRCPPANIYTQSPPIYQPTNLHTDRPTYLPTYLSTDTDNVPLLERLHQAQAVVRVFLGGVLLQRLRDALHVEGGAGPRLFCWLV